MLAGALLSAAVSPQVAFASGSAFLISEILDLLVYTRVRRINFLLAVAASNIVGLIIDSMIFLILAFGSLQHLDGQIVGKAYMTILTVSIIALVRRKR